jgi:hypothetical protein
MKRGVRSRVRDGGDHCGLRSAIVFVTNVTEGEEGIDGAFTSLGIAHTLAETGTCRLRRNAVVATTALSASTSRDGIR